VLVARFGSLAVVPVYDLALNAAGRLRALIEAGHRALSTEVSRLSADDGRDARAKVKHLINKSTRPVLLMLIPVVLFISFVPLPLKLWLGSRYVPEVATTVRIMVVGNYLSLFATPAYYVLVGRGRSRDIFVHFVIQGVVNCTIVFGLLCFQHSLTATKAAAAYALGVVVSALYLIWREKRAWHPTRMNFAKNTTNSLVEQSSVAS
jgi:O-antigen/teichoic acid export membrane protein